MAVAFDAVGPGASGTVVTGAPPSTPLTWSHTCSGSDRLVVVSVSYAAGGAFGGDDSTATLSATYDGISMTSAGVKHSNDANYGFAQVFYLVAPPTGSKTVSVSLSGWGGNTVNIIAGSVSFTGVHQTTPTRNFASTAGVSSTPAVSVTTATGNMAIGFIVAGASISSATQTTRWSNNLNASTGAGNVNFSTATGSGSVSMGATLSGSDSSACIGMDLVAATAHAWVERTPLRGSSIDVNGTNSHTCTFTAATSGNFLVAVVAGAVTFTTPSGWTLAISAVANTGLYVFTKTASSGESSFSTTHNASDYAIRGVVYEYPAGTSVIDSNSATAQNRDATVTGPVVSGLTGTYTRMAARSYAMNNTSSTADTAWTVPATEDYDAYTPRSGGLDGVLLTVAYDDNQTASSFNCSSYITTTNVTTANGEGVAFALNVATSGTPTPIAWII